MQVVELMISDRSAIVIDLSVVINALGKRKSIKPTAIGVFCYKNVYMKRYLMNPKDAQLLL